MDFKLKLQMKNSSVLKKKREAMNEAMRMEQQKSLVNYLLI